MADTIVFEGNRDQVVEQLAHYMNIKDANKFFTHYFIKDSVPVVHGFKQRSVTIDKRIGVAAMPFNTRVCQKNRRYLIASGERRDLTHANTTVECRKTAKPLTLKEIENTSFTISNNKKTFSKTFYKKAFIFAAIALDIVLYVTLDISGVVTIAEIIEKFVSLQKNEKDVAICIASIVKKQMLLPRYSTFRKSKCKNINIQCIFYNEGRCNITKESYVKVINQLIKKGILKFNE